MKHSGELILYKNFENGELFYNFTWILENYDSEFYNRSDIVELYYRCLNQLIELAVSHGFEGNLWHCFLAFIMVNNENAYSTACEMKGAVNGSINAIAAHDFAILKEMFDYNLNEVAKTLEIDDMDVLQNFKGPDDNGSVFNKRIRDCICELAVELAGAKDTNAFQDSVTGFYARFGVGNLGLHKAFRIQNTNGVVELAPITRIAHVKLDDLVGYEIAKKKLVDNTEAFVKGKSANNCLLFGDAGTGKSTSIKAILNEYYSRGLRMIEVYKHEFQYLSQIIAEIKNRNYRFIIYMDDLSFEEFEIEYKYLKAVIEGGLETKPDNVLIYATSNRRHLIRETWSDRSDMSQDELHRSDTMQEKLSLAARFGVTIGYYRPKQQEYFEIVKQLAKKYPQITLSEEELCLKANQWELSHGGISGRTATQFIANLAGSVLQDEVD